LPKEAETLPNNHLGFLEVKMIFPCRAIFYHARCSLAASRFSDVQSERFRKLLYDFIPQAYAEVLQLFPFGHHSELYGA
jgi:hypothetical protein